MEKRHPAGEGWYRATVVDSEPYLPTVMRYVELHPVRGHGCPSRGLPRSSYYHHAQGESGSNADCLAAHEEYLRSGRYAAEGHGTCRQLFQAAISGDHLAETRECTHKLRASGGERFWERVEVPELRRAASQGVGRTRKETNRSNPVRALSLRNCHTIAIRKKAVVDFLPIIHQALGGPEERYEPA